MAVLNLAVILWSWSEPGAPVQLHDRAWYEDLFFSPLHGHAAYWLKQSSESVHLSGQVFDWTFDSTAQRDFSSRSATARMAVQHFEAAHDLDFGRFQCVVVVLGVPKSKYANVDGGSTRVDTRAGRRRAIVTRVDDPFDFLAHEIGHALGLEHSFTFDTSLVPIGEAPGGYGHPHCLMSARVYGNSAEAQHDAPLPLGSDSEYRSIGPSVNGVIAFSRGWVDAHPVALQPGFSGEFELRTRQWGGRDPAQPPQALHLTRADGATFVVDACEPLWWDAGLGGHRLVLTQDVGGLADTHYPGQHSGTFLASLPLPRPTLDTALKPPPGTGLEVRALHLDAQRHVLRVRISQGAQGTPAIALDTTVDTQTDRTGVTGTTTFAPGERFCIEGSFDHEELRHRHTATLDATHALARFGCSAEWTVDGVPCTGSVGTLVLHRTVFVADPKRNDLTMKRNVRVPYRIDPLPDGSRLRLANRPEDESYALQVQVTLRTSVAAGSAATEVTFTGREFRFGPDYVQAFEQCTQAFLRRKLKDAQHLVTFAPRQKLEFDPRGGRDVVGWMQGLGTLLAAGDRAGFEAASVALRRSLMAPALQLTTIATADTVEVVVPARDLPPPGVQGAVASVPPAPPPRPSPAGSGWATGFVLGVLGTAVVWALASALGGR